MARDGVAAELLAVSTNLPEVAAKLRSFPVDQLPFATALALTRIAYKVRDRERAQAERQFTIRARWTLRQITADLTRKGEWPTPAVRVGDEYAPFEKLELGGVKTPEVGYADVFIPTRFVASQRSPTTGRIPAALNARSLIARDLVHVEELPGLGRALVLNAPVGSAAGGGRRRGARRINEAGFTKMGQTRALYLLRSSAKIPARFGFRQVAEKTTAVEFAAVFSDALDFALRTRRAR